MGKTQKKILAIAGSLKQNSSNLAILKHISQLLPVNYEVKIYEGLADLPHFSPDLDNEKVPSPVIDLRTEIQTSDGVVICTPEYVFSIPSTLKNLIEWCVSTTVFSEKPVALITASASGEKGHEELKLLMKTIYTKFNDETTLLIQGIKGKVNSEGKVIDNEVLLNLEILVTSFIKLLE